MASNSSIPAEAEIGAVKRSCRSSFFHQLILWPICSGSEWEAEISRAASRQAGEEDPDWGGSFLQTDALLHQVKHLVLGKPLIQNHQNPPRVRVNTRVRAGAETRTSGAFIHSVSIRDTLPFWRGTTPLFGSGNELHCHHLLSFTTFIMRRWSPDPISLDQTYLKAQFQTCLHPPEGNVLPFSSMFLPRVPAPGFLSSVLRVTTFST